MNKKLSIHHIAFFSFTVVLLTSNALKPMKRSVADVSQGAADLQYNKRQKTTENENTAEETTENSTSFLDLPPDVKEKIIAMSSNKNAIGLVNKDLNELASNKNSLLMYHDPLYLSPRDYHYQLIRAIIEDKKGIVNNLMNQFSEYQFTLKDYKCLLIQALINKETDIVDNLSQYEGEGYEKAKRIVYTAYNRMNDFIKVVIKGNIEGVEGIDRQCRQLKKVTSIFYQ
jgi:hypothetical protein